MSSGKIHDDSSGISPVVLGWAFSVGATTFLVAVLTAAYLRTPDTGECPEAPWLEFIACPWWDEFVRNVLLIGSIGIVVVVPLLVIVVLGREIFR